MMESKELKVLRRSVSVIVGAQAKLRDDIEELESRVEAATAKEKSALEREKEITFSPTSTFTEAWFITKLQSLLCIIESYYLVGEKANLKYAIRELSLMAEKTLFYFDEAKRDGNDQIASRFYSFSEAARAVERLAEELL